MTDIFDTKIVCTKCNVRMEPKTVERSGTRVRAVECPKCDDKIIHPADVAALDHYNQLRGKTFNVKLRVVGNSHAISIPKEIVNFMQDMQHQMKKEMDDMVKLCFEDFGRLRLDFGLEEENEKDK